MTMACPTKYQKSSLRAYNSTEQAFTTPGNIKFSNIGYISGTSISLKENSDTIYLRTNGLYYITIDVIMSNATAATNTTVQLYVDGDEVTGALTEATLTTNTDFQAGTISAVIPVNSICCSCGKGIPVTFRVLGTTPQIEGANLNIFRLA